jgi:predicted transcriptional regulator
MAKKINTIEVQIATYLRSNPKVSVSNIASRLGMSENSVNIGLHYIRKNVLLPNEMILRSGKYGRSKYELVNVSSYDDDIKNKMNYNERNMLRMFVDMTKTAKIANATRSPSKRAALNALVIKQIATITTGMTQVSLLQLPIANV